MIYLLGIRDRKLVDETFDKMHKQSHFKWIDKETLFSFPIFIIQKWANRKRKERAMINIQGLNNIIISDAYPVPLQDKIIYDLQRWN